MAKITLRSYNREIESMIDAGHIDEATAHCRHILKTYPKHIETYRLLGKAFLESQRYGDAADILQRVLSSVPEDFVSHVGMSIIREDEGNLDEAIWHMERAFEMQPANNAIQEELRRLYGRRDGLEPPKVRLTRGALARMYARGDLHQQAIAELRAALAEDQNRLDLQSLLARVYSRAGMRVEAAEMVNAVLRKLPYCLEANRVLLEVLTGSEHAEETQAYKQRIIALDPYAAHINPSAPNVEKVPDQAVTIEKLAWKPGQPSGGRASQPDWAASLGVELNEVSPGKEALPDWLSAPQAVTPDFGAPPSEKPGTSAFAWDTPAAPGSATPDWMDTPEEAAAQPAAEEEIPEWMRAAGWGPSTGAADEHGSTVLLDDDEDVKTEGEIVSADIPEWLRDLAPPVDTAEPEAESDTLDLPWEQPAAAAPAEPAAALPDWLQALPSARAADEPETEASEPLELPDWLSESPAGAAEWPQEKAPGTAPAIEADLDWFSESPAGATGWPQEKAAESAPAMASGLDWLSESPADSPDWLQGLGSETTPAVESGLQAAEEEDLPEWLRDIAPRDIAPVEIQPAPAAEPEPESTLPEPVAPSPDLFAAPLAAPAAESTPAAMDDMDAAFAWLESLAVKQGADEALLLKPEDRRETPPEWVQATAEPVAAEPQAEMPVLEEMQAQPESLPVEASPAEALPDWLSEFATSTPELPAAGEPEWLQAESASVETGSLETDLIEVESGEAGLMEAEPVEELPDWLRDIEPADAAALDQALPGWRQDLQALEAAPAGPAVDSADWFSTPEPEEAAAPAEALPDWLQAFEPGEPPAATPVEATPPVAQPVEELPSWLNDLETEPAGAGAGTSQPAGELPSWLESVVEEKTQPVSEAAPAEELPAWLSDMASEPAEELPTPLPPTPVAVVEPPVTVQPPAEAGMLGDDLDAAFAWLESLAVKQGADEALLLKPDERRETPPDWVTAAAAVSATQPVAATEPEILPEPVEIETFPAPIHLEADAPEVPAAVQEAVVEPEPELEPELESELAPEPEAEPAEQIPAWMLEGMLPAAEPEAEEPEAEKVEVEAALPSWLEETPLIEGDTKPVRVSRPVAATTPPVEPVVVPSPVEKVVEEPSQAETVQVPDWLKEEVVVAEVELPTLEPPAEAPVEAAPAAASTFQPLDEDAAFAWLEALAVKQGADEALLLAPEKRLETPPPWVLEAVLEEANKLPPAQEIAPSAEEQVSAAVEALESAPDIAPVSAQPEPASPEATAPVEMPAWMQEVGVPEAPPVELSKPEVARSEPEAPRSDLPAPQIVRAEPPPPVKPVVPSAPAVVAPPPAAAKPAPQAPVAKAPARGSESLPELPSWLTEAAPETAEEEWTPPSEVFTPQVTQPPAVPLRRFDLNKASLSELERLPGIGFIMAQRIITQREAVGLFRDIEELTQLPNFTPAMLDDIREYIYVEEIQPVIASQPEESASPELNTARAALNHGNVHAAIECYAELIKNRKFLPEIIRDLHEALYRFPVEMSIWQNLGDAYLRSDQLQEALDAYTRAEELLR